MTPKSFASATTFFVSGSAALTSHLLRACRVTPIFSANSSWVQFRARRRLRSFSPKVMCVPPSEPRIAKWRGGCPEIRRGNCATGVYIAACGLDRSPTDAIPARREGKHERERRNSRQASDMRKPRRRRGFFIRLLRSQYCRRDKFQQLFCGIRRLCWRGRADGCGLHRTAQS